MSQIGESQEKARIGVFVMVKFLQPHERTERKDHGRGELFRAAPSAVKERIERGVARGLIDPIEVLEVHVAPGTTFKSVVSDDGVGWATWLACKHAGVPCPYIPMSVEEYKRRFNPWGMA